MDGIYTMASSSVSSLYGNVNAAVREYLLSRFPCNYFKYVGLSTEAAFHNIRRKLGGNNSRKSIEKRQRPYIVIQPIYQVADRDTFLQEVPLSRNLDDLQYRTDGRYLLDIIADEKYGYKLKYKINRDRIEFDVRIVLSTLHQQIDLYKAMQNQITWERTFSKQTALEAVIPKHIIHEIGKMCKMDVSEHDYMIPLLLERMNACSQYPITYKLRTASATDEYYMYYSHKVYMCFYDLSIDEGVKIGMVDDHYDITFKVSAEFNLPGLYVITGNIQKLDNYRVVLSASNAYGYAGDPTNSDYIPLFTMDNIYSRYPPERDGMRLLGSSRFICDGVEKLEELDISTIFTLDQKKVIGFYTSYNMNPDTIVKMYVVKNNTEMTEGIDYDMDWHTFTLTVKEPDKEATYRILIYINLNTINDVLADLHESKLYDKPGAQKNNLHREEQFPVVADPSPMLPGLDLEGSSDIDPSEEEPKKESTKPEVTTRQIEDSVKLWCDILSISDVFNARKDLVFETSEGVE